MVNTPTAYTSGRYRAGYDKFNTGVSYGMVYDIKKQRSFGWPGLVSVTSSTTNADFKETYMDGIAVAKYQTIPRTSFKVDCLTFPEDLIDIMGYAKNGSYQYNNQYIRPINLAYVSGVYDRNGNKVEEKLHLIYNVLPSLNELTNTTLTKDLSAPTVSINFEPAIDTSLYATSTGLPFNEIILNTWDTNPQYLSKIFAPLYGSAGTVLWPKISDIMTLYTIQ